MKVELLKALSNASRKQLHIILGMVMLLMGLILLVNDQFFFWPPEWSRVLNNDFVDVAAVLTGTGLLIYSFAGTHSRLTNAVLLGLSAFFITVFVVLEIGHAIALHDYGRLVFAIPAIGMLMLVQYLVHLAKKSRK